MFLHDFDGYVKRNLIFALANELDAVPEQPGVYAWFLPFEADATVSVRELMRSLCDGLKASTALTQVEADVGATTVALRMAVPSFDLELQAAQAADQAMTRRQRENLGQLLLALSLLAPPIYVGLARGKRGLRGRLEQHLAGETLDPQWLGSFHSRVRHVMEDASLLRRCVIACMPLPSGMPPEATRVLEHILIRVVRPAQSRRG